MEKSMSNQIDDGGSAFPGENDESKQYHWVHRGMSLRDYFAAKAMQAKCFQQLAVVLARSLHPVDGQSVTLNLNHDGIAKDCYDFADAMLRARKSGGEH
jgi:hypothetical protein